LGLLYGGLDIIIEKKVTRLMTRKISVLLIVILILICTVAYADGTPSPTPAPTSNIASVDMNIMNTIPWWVWTVLVAVGSLLLALKQHIKEKKSKREKR
jgi:transposase